MSTNFCTKKSVPLDPGYFAVPAHTLHMSSAPNAPGCDWARLAENQTGRGAMTIAVSARSTSTFAP
jgi:hypothetical protein